MIRGRIIEAIIEKGYAVADEPVDRDSASPYLNIKVGGAVFTHEVRILNQYKRISAWNMEDTGHHKVVFDSFGGVAAKTFLARKDGTHDYPAIAARIISMIPHRIRADAEFQAYGSNREAARGFKLDPIDGVDITITVGLEAGKPISMRAVFSPMTEERARLVAAAITQALKE